MCIIQDHVSFRTTSGILHIYEFVTVNAWQDLTDKEHKMSRGSIDMDQAGRIEFGPDSRSLLIHMARNNTLGWLGLAVGNSAFACFRRVILCRDRKTFKIRVWFEFAMAGDED